MRRKAAILSSLTAVSGVALHFVAHAYVGLYDAAALQLTATKAAVIEGLAEDFGFERKQEPDEPLSPSALCTMEAVRRNINPVFVCENMRAESAEDQFALSAAGAIGLMQVMPANIPLCGECGVRSKNDLLNDQKNICCGTLLLDRFLKQNGDDPVKALQAYNGGQRCIGRCAESINHMAKVLKAAVRSKF